MMDEYVAAPLLLQALEDIVAADCMGSLNEAIEAARKLIAEVKGQDNG